MKNLTRVKKKGPTPIKLSIASKLGMNLSPRLANKSIHVRKVVNESRFSIKGKLIKNEVLPPRPRFSPSNTPKMINFSDLITKVNIPKKDSISPTMSKKNLPKILPSFKAVKLPRIHPITNTNITELSISPLLKTP